MRQAEEEWDNPFQPEGEVSQDADLIIQLWKGGRLTETEDLHENLKTLALESSETDSKDDSLESSEGNIVSPVSPVISPCVRTNHGESLQFPGPNQQLIRPIRKNFNHLDKNISTMRQKNILFFETKKLFET